MGIGRLAPVGSQRVPLGVRARQGQDGQVADQRSDGRAARRGCGRPSGCRRRATLHVPMVRRHRAERIGQRRPGGRQASRRGRGSGFQLKVPLPRQTERLRLWVSAYEGTGVLTATVPGLPAVTNTEMVGKTNDHGGVFEIDVQGSGDLTVTFVLTCPQAGGCTADSHVTMYAAAYTWTGEPPSFTVNVTAGQPADFTIVQGDTTPRTSKVTTTAINPPLTQVALSTSVTTAAGDPGTGLSATVSPATVSTFPATSDVTINPAVGVATGTYHVTVAGDRDRWGDRRQHGQLHGHRPPAHPGAVPLPRVPERRRRCLGRGRDARQPEPDVQDPVRRAAACSADRTPGGVITVPAGPVIEVATDASGDAYLGHGIAIPLDTKYLTARVTDYRSATTPEVIWTPLGDTAYGPCIVVSDPNESWPTAAPIATGGTGVSQFVDDIGRSRWYRFEVQPGSRVRVTLDGLPKDYDVYLFRDILQAYLAGGSLLEQSASYAPPSYAPPSYAPPSYAPDSLAPPSYAPPSYAPPSYAPPSYAPPSYAPPSYAPPSPTRRPATRRRATRLRATRPPRGLPPPTLRPRTLRPPTLRPATRRGTRPTTPTPRPAASSPGTSMRAPCRRRSTRTRGRTRATSTSGSTARTACTTSSVPSASPSRQKATSVPASSRPTRESRRPWRPLTSTRRPARHR